MTVIDRQDNDDALSSYEDDEGESSQSDKTSEQLNEFLSKVAKSLQKNNIIINSLNNQVDGLVDDNNYLKKQVSELISSRNNGNMILDGEEEDDFLTEDKKSSLFVYIALALAALAFIMSIGSITSDYAEKSDVDSLSKKIVVLEQESTNVESKDLKIEIEKLNRQVSFLTSARHQTSTQLKDINAALKIAKSTPVVSRAVKKDTVEKQSIKQLSETLSSREKGKSLGSTASSKETVLGRTWIVNLVSLKQKPDAVIKVKEFNEKGITAEMVPVNVNGDAWFRLIVGGFKSQDKAVSSIANIKEKLGLSDVWVSELKQ